MTPAAVPANGQVLLLYALIAIITLIVLIARAKLNPFIALAVVSLGMGVAAGMPLTGIVNSFQAGVGGVLGFIAVVVALGTMLGKLLAESGGAERIARTLIGIFGEKNVHWAIMFVAFIVGMPVFFQVGFVLLVPLVFTIARRTGTSLVLVGVPLVAGLSIVHGLVPPHPAAMLAVGTFKADVGLTIIYSVIVGLPAAALAGPIYAKWIAPKIQLPEHNPLAEQLGETSRGEDLPGFGISVFTILLPVLLMVGSSIADLTLASGTPLRNTLNFIGNPVISLLIALLVAFWTFGAQRGFTREDLQKFTNDCLGPTATILLVIGAGGGFNRVLLDSGVGRAIADMATSLHVPLLTLAFVVAAVIRVATGSATVALTTAAGIVAPIAAASPGAARPELLVLATGAGSIILSHVNDSGFWLIKEYFNMTVAQTLKTWTALETILAVSAFAFTLLLAQFV
ncbi:Gluconate permease (plasmid) [Rhodovastum atsumiense]|uniref:GntP family permease n=1 Tax=Rhodovastum atsumiense TaxID=504468 RepID=UPI002023C8E2|nr:GntP family permease [Rhodovastum atsumiense]CAH2605436.1 Gluconate permease [Rhodovastum atsumiense]